MEVAFSTYHPAVNLTFFAGAILCGMFFVHPAFLIIALICSASYYVLLKKAKALKAIRGLLIVFVAISVLNPLFNPRGATVLFTLGSDRPFTLEALYYGMATGSMFLCIAFWFACYNEVMTSEKFIYLFEKCIPALSLVLSMVLRMLPSLQRSIRTIVNARKCIGKAPENAAQNEKLQNGMTVLSVLTSWALESAVVTADSMRSRGYGTGKRTSFACYAVQKRDRIFWGVLGASFAAVVFSLFCGAASASYLPTLAFSPISATTLLGLTGYSVFLSLPCIIHIWEEIKWRILRSKI